LELFNNKKADIEAVDSALGGKVDVKAFEEMLERLNRVEELAASSKRGKSPKGKKTSDGSPTVPGSPDSIRKVGEDGLEIEGEEDDDDDDDDEGIGKAALEELKKKMDE